MINRFKNASIVLIDAKSSPSINVFEEKLNQQRLPPLFSAEKFVEGFVYPYPFAEQMIFQIEHTWKMQFSKEERILPNSVVNNQLTERIAKIEENELRKVGKKEKRELKETVYLELVPQAFTKVSNLEIIYNSQNNYLLINQSSKTKVEQFLTKFREAMGGLGMSFLDTTLSVTTLMSNWIKQGYADGNFILDNFCELKSTTDTNSIVKFSRHNLLSKEIIEIANNNRFVSQLGLIWDDKVKFILNSDFSLKQICLLDIESMERDNELQEDEQDEQLITSANQLLITDILTKIYAELIKHAGGQKVKDE